jgi:APA family basic amino acid/polyamine antiporter
MGLGLGVAALMLLYVVVNLAYLQVVPIELMRQAPTTVASKVSTASFGPQGGKLLNILVGDSMFGAMGGLVMTLPRLCYTMAAECAGECEGPPRVLFRALSHVSAGSGVPRGAILFTCGASVAALAFFASFSKLANFLVVPAQLANILMVPAVFRLRRKLPAAAYRTPGYPVTPLLYIAIMLCFLISALVFRPIESLMGLSLSATGVPVYFWLKRTKS